MPESAKRALQKKVLSGVDFWGKMYVKNVEHLVASPRVFPLSLRMTFTCEFQSFTQKFTPLSTIRSRKIFTRFLSATFTYCACFLFYLAGKIRGGGKRKPCKSYFGKDCKWRFFYELLSSIGLAKWDPKSVQLSNRNKSCFCPVGRRILSPPAARISCCYMFHNLALTALVPPAT